MKEGLKSRLPSRNLGTEKAEQKKNGTTMLYLAAGIALRAYRKVMARHSSSWAVV